MTRFGVDRFYLFLTFCISVLIYSYYHNVLFFNDVFYDKSLEFFKVFWSPHFLWVSCLLFLSFRFRSSFSSILDAIANKIPHLSGVDSKNVGLKFSNTIKQPDTPKISDSSFPKIVPGDITINSGYEKGLTNVEHLRAIASYYRISGINYHYGYLDSFLDRYHLLFLLYICADKKVLKDDLADYFLPYFDLIDFDGVLSVLIINELVSSDLKYFYSTKRGQEYFANSGEKRLKSMIGSSRVSADSKHVDLLKIFLMNQDYKS